MAEIKSTLDLIMEKTRHLSMNEDEKSALKNQELAQKVRGIAHAFLRGDKNIRFFVQEMNRFPPDQQEEARRLCLDCFLEQITPFDDNHRPLKGVENLLDKAAREHWDNTLGEMKKTVLEKQARVLEAVEEQTRQVLASKGLQGPALLPGSEQSPRWKEEREKLVETFRASVKNTLRPAYYR